MVQFSRINKEVKDKLSAG